MARKLVSGLPQLQPTPHLPNQSLVHGPPGCTSAPGLHLSLRRVMAAEWVQEAASSFFQTFSTTLVDRDTARMARLSLLSPRGRALLFPSPPTKKAQSSFTTSSYCDSVVGLVYDEELEPATFAAAVAASVSRGIQWST